jgi:hypothetical protein
MRRTCAGFAWFPVAIRAAVWEACSVASTLVPAPPAPPPAHQRPRRVVSRVFDAVALAAVTLAREAPARPPQPRPARRFSR